MKLDVSLRNDVAGEPLVAGWFAWLHAIAPIPSALLTDTVHLPTMKSYVSAPQVHANAATNVALRGGQFVDLDGDRSEDVAALIRTTESSRSLQMKMAEDLRHLDGLVGSLAKGATLDPLYDLVPPTLRGLVELVYDRSHHPSVRILEGLTYRSDAYRESDQSLDLFVVGNDARPFILSTPRLRGEGRVRLDFPLSDERLDLLFASRINPRSYAQLRDECEVSTEEECTFRSLFTEGSEARNPGDDVSSGIRVRYFGHACVVVETAEAALIIDPMVSARPGVDGRYSWADLPERLDYCLLTHGHQDHFVLESLLPLRHRIGAVVVPKSQPGVIEDPSLKMALTALGFPVVIEVDAFDALPFGRGEILATPFFGEHADLGITSKVTYVVDASDNRILFAADSAAQHHELFDRIYDTVGPIDTVFLGMECDGAPVTWLYGHLFSHPIERRMSRSRKLSGSNARQAMQMIERTGATRAYVYVMGQEPWLQHIMATNYTEGNIQNRAVAEVLDECHRRGVEAERLLISRTFEWNSESRKVGASSGWINPKVSC